MCGRFSLFVPDKIIRQRFDIDLPDDLPHRYNVAPRQDLLAVRNDETGRGDMLHWGLVPGWADDPEDGPQPINARSETVAEKPMFREAYQKRRCLVLADGYYEWQGDRGSKRPYRIERQDREPFAFAGIWERWGEGEDELHSCAILTTEPTKTIEQIHDRMPLMLEPEEEAIWLGEGNGEVLEDVLDPYADDELRAYEIPTRVNDPDNDDESVIRPLDDEQSGIGDFAA